MVRETEMMENTKGYSAYLGRQKRDQMQENISKGPSTNPFQL